MATRLPRNSLLNKVWLFTCMAKTRVFTMQGVALDNCYEMLSTRFAWLKENVTQLRQNYPLEI